MAETVTYAGSATATGGPAVGFAVALEVEGYGKGNGLVAMGKKKTIPLNTPGANVAIFLIRASKYGDALTVSAGTLSKTPLNAPLIVGGAGVAAKILGGATGFEFENNLGEDVTVEVFVARNA